MGRPQKAPEPAEDEQEISEVLRGLGEGNIIVKLYEVDGFGRHKFREKIPLEALQSGDIESVIKLEFGPGSWLLRVVKDGKFIKNGNKMIHIAGESEGIYQPIVPDNSAAALQLKMIEMQMQMSKESSERTFQMMTAFNSSIMGIMSAVITGAKPMDPLVLAGLLKGSGGGAAESVALLKEVLALSKEISPGASNGEADPMLTLIQTALPLIGKSGDAPLPQRPVASLPASIPPPGQVKLPDKIDNPQATENTELAERERFLAKLKLKAAMGQEVDFWADYIEMNADEGPCKWLAEVVQQYPFDVLWAGLVKHDPALAGAPYPEWFRGLFEALKQEEAGPVEEEAEK